MHRRVVTRRIFYNDLISPGPKIGNDHCRGVVSDKDLDSQIPLVVSCITATFYPLHTYIYPNEYPINKTLLLKLHEMSYDDEKKRKKRGQKIHKKVLTYIIYHSN